MEYVDGENLSDVIARGPVSAGRGDHGSRRQLCRFLDAAHRFKTIDRRPRVLVARPRRSEAAQRAAVAEAGEIKVLDFGIAKALSLSRKVTRNDFGSMPYLSPERLESTEVDAQADLWALGVILYELLSGTPPFQAVDTRRLEQQIRAGYPPPSASGALSGCAAGDRGAAARARTAAIATSRAAAVLADLGSFDAGQPTAGADARVSRHASTKRRRDARGRRRRRCRRRRGGPSDAGHARTPRRRRRRRAIRLPIGADAACAVPHRSRRGRSRSASGSATRPDARGAAPRLQRARRRLPGEPGRGASAMTRDLDGMDDMWTEYDALSQRSYLRVGVVGLERDAGDAGARRCRSR